MIKVNVHYTLNSARTVTLGISAVSGASPGSISPSLVPLPGNTSEIYTTLPAGSGTFSFFYTAPASFSAGVSNISLLGYQRDVTISMDGIAGLTLEGTTQIKVVRPPVLLLHGWTGDMSSWSDFSSNLNRRLNPSVLNSHKYIPWDNYEYERGHITIVNYKSSNTKAFNDNQYILRD